MPYKKSVFFLLITFCTSALFAQSNLDAATENSTVRNTSAKNSSNPGMNIVKFNLMGAGLKNYSFQYERVITKHISLALGFRTMPSTGIPYSSAFKNAVDATDANTISMIDKLRLKNTAITPEIRFYVGRKGYGKGFYFAPYYRYASFHADNVPVEYSSGTGGSKTLNLVGDVKTNAAGLMIGAQWNLGKYVTLDWWIIGAHYGTVKGTLNGIPSSPLTTEEQNDIKQTLDDISLPVGNIRNEVTANNVKVIIDGPWAGVRSGLTLGVRF